MTPIEKLEKIWEQQKPYNDDVRSAITYEYNKENGGWRFYECGCAIVTDGKVSLAKAIDAAYKKAVPAHFWSDKRVAMEAGCRSVGKS